jgi:hypothetical protein
MIKRINAIRRFARRQQLIGAHKFALKITKRYSKPLDEFYRQFSDNIYYEKDGEKTGLNVQTNWYLKTNAMLKGGVTPDLIKANMKVMKCLALLSKELDTRVVLTKEDVIGWIRELEKLEQQISDALFETK